MPTCHDALRCVLVVCFSFVLEMSELSASERFTFHHENVLGTSLEIQLEAESQTVAAEAETEILSEINRLAKVFSGYDRSSEFSNWQRQSGEAVVVSPELFRVLKSCDHWHRLSNGAFNPAVEELTQLWKRAETHNQLPDPDELAKTVARVGQPHWKFDDATGRTIRTSTVGLSLNAIAKGAIIESVCQSAMRRGDVRGVIVNIGGDLRAAGQAVTQINIANPQHDAVNAPPLKTIYIRECAVATSGNYRRGVTINGQWYSHIIDPRTGQPVAEIASATVVAANSSDADALATILNVLPVEESVALVNSLADVHCFIVTTTGAQFSSRNWNDLEQPGLFRYASAKGTSQLALAAADDKVEDLKAASSPKSGAKKDADTQPGEAKSSDAKSVEGKAKVVEEVKATGQENGLLELVVNFELNRPANGQYRRPYVAIWLEDADEFPVRTAILWMQTKQPGPRWHRDLLRWYRNDSVRKLADGTALIGTISSATRNAGAYKAVFDGKDDAGKLLPPGNYTLFIEVAREHGTYQLIRHKMTLGQEPIAETKLKENVEIKSASVEYRARSSEPAPAAVGPASK